MAKTLARNFVSLVSRGERLEKLIVLMARWLMTNICPTKYTHVK